MKSLRAASIVVFVLLNACAVGPGYHAPKSDLPSAFAAAPVLTSGSGTNHAPTELAVWWQSLQDVELNSLVDRAVRSNPDLQIALDRLQQARTYESVVVGYALPETNASAAAGRGTGSDLTKGRADPYLRSADTGAGLQQINVIAGFSAVWQLDLFGKFRRELQAARADTEAARAARYEVLTIVVADVVRAYVDLRGFQVRDGILHQTIEVLRDSLRLVKARYERGITNELDVALAERELATREAELAPLAAQVNAAQYTLAVLVGEYPENMVQELQKPALIPVMPGVMTANAPVDLLKRRPDIQQAEWEVVANTARIGVAAANLFPQISISGSIGSQSQGWGTAPHVGMHIWSFGPAAEWPLLDFGALDAEVDIADITAHASLVNYRRTILNAVRQVDTSLEGYRGQQARLDSLGDAVLAGQRAIELATARYDRGLTDFLNVVDAEREFYDLEASYASAQVAQAEAFVQLYQSLGGGWQNYEALPGIRRPQPAIVAAFRRVLESRSPR